MSNSVVFKLEDTPFGSFHWEMSEEVLSTLFPNINVDNLEAILEKIEGYVPEEDLAELANAFQQAAMSALTKMVMIHT